MTNWHGYFVVEKQNIGAGNWESLKALFEGMGTDDSPMPAHNNHRRTRLDGNAVIYESRFDSDEVSLGAFKQLLADEFGVDVNDIESTTDIVVYGDYDTAVWQFAYPVGGDDRFQVERFGRGGGDWEVSRNECLGYLFDNAAEWVSEDD